MHILLQDLVVQSIRKLILMTAIDKCKCLEMSCSLIHLNKSVAGMVFRTSANSEAKGVQKTSRACFSIDINLGYDCTVQY